MSIHTGSKSCEWCQDAQGKSPQGTAPALPAQPITHLACPPRTLRGLGRSHSRTALKKPNWLFVIEEFWGFRPIPDPTNSNFVVIQMETGLNFSWYDMERRILWAVNTFFTESILLRACTNYFQASQKCNTGTNVILDPCCPTELPVMMECSVSAPSNTIACSRLCLSKFLKIKIQSFGVIELKMYHLMATCSQWPLC